MKSNSKRTKKGVWYAFVIIVTALAVMLNMDEDILTVDAEEENPLWELFYPDDYLYTTRSNDHLPFGFPQDNDTTDDYIIERPQYVVSYCAKKNTANWVGWHLSESWIGDEPRFTGQFRADTSLPDTFYRVTHSDYTHSGYDRGHIVRSKERSRTREDNISTFILSNVFPQTPDLNRGVWLKFEDYCLQRAKQTGKHAYIIAGGVYHTNRTLHDAGKVMIPDSCFKITLFTELPSFSDGYRLSDIDVVAVMMPNTDGVRRDDWQQYQTTVEHIEASTGYRFFMRMPQRW